MRHLILPFLLLLLKVPGRAQQNSEVDFKQLDARVQVHPQEKIVVGEVRFIFDILKDTDSIFIDAREMEISNFSLNGNPVDFHNDAKRLGFASPSKISEENELRFNYTAAPRQTMYFIGWDYPDTSYKPQVWTQGQGKYTSHWLPSFDDPTEKLIFNLDLIFPENLEVISNGKLVAKEAEGDTLTRWQFEMQQPMSSYLVAVAAGTYYKEEIVSSSGVPISLYFYPGDENKLEPTYRYSEQIFDFLEKETGVPYPWQDYKQIPVRDFLYSGMENTGATIFSDIF